MKNFIIYNVVLVMIFFSCGDEVLDQQLPQSDSLQVSEEAIIFEPQQDQEIAILKKDGITLTEIKSSNEENISLELITTSFKEGLNELQFSVKGMEDYTIAMIENNYTITHSQKNSIQKEFMYGNNVFLAFLTHPNGISVKTNNALVLKNVLIDDENLFKMNQPHLFYYLPKAQTNLPILDFCLVNTTIKQGENNLKVTINGVEFFINKWAAYQIEGLTTINNVIRIQLVDKNGRLIEGPFNDSGDRKFQLIKEAV